MPTRIFTVGRPGSDVPNSIGLAFRSTPKSNTNIGAIVGGVVGGLAFLGLIGLGVFFYIRKRRRSQRAPSAIAKEEQAAALKREKYHDEDGGAQYAQYATRPISDTFTSTHSGFPTPPHSAFSATSQQGLLPEPQSPQSPYLGIPGSNANMFTTSPLGSASSRGPYSPSDAGQSVYTNAEGQNILVNPYILPPSSSQTPPSSLGHSRDNKLQYRQGQGQSQNGHFQRGSVNLINLDPMGPGSSLGEASEQMTSELGDIHFTPPPPPPVGAMRPSKAAAGDMSRWPGRREQTPAPPYSSSDGQPISPTLVEYSPTDQQRNSARFSQ